jgi:transposase InsO family protein
VEAVEIWSGSAHDNPWDRTGRRVDGLGIDRRHLKIQDAGEAELSGGARSDQTQGNAHVRKMLVEAGWSGWRAACSRRAEGQWSLCCRKRIARPMRAAGIADVSRRRSAPITTVQATGHHPVISSAATSWPSDPTSSEWPTSPSCRRWPARSLAVVLDTWSRIIGWAFSADLKTRVALDALDMALVARARQWIRASFCAA